MEIRRVGLLIGKFYIFQLLFLPKERVMSSNKIIADLRLRLEKTEDAIQTNKETTDAEIQVLKDQLRVQDDRLTKQDEEITYLKSKLEKLPENHEGANIRPQAGRIVKVKLGGTTRVSSLSQFG